MLLTVEDAVCRGSCGLLWKIVLTYWPTHPSRDRIIDVRNGRENGAILWLGFLVNERTEIYRGEMPPNPSLLILPIQATQDSLLSK